MAASGRSPVIPDGPGHAGTAPANHSCVFSASSAKAIPAARSTTGCEGEYMGKAHARARGAFPPERFVAALVDFGPGRAEVWGNSDPERLAVHDRGDTWAEVT